MKKSALALAAVLVLALTAFASTGSAADVYSHAPKVDVYGHAATGFSSGADSDVRSTTPDQDVRGVHAPKVDVRSIAGPDASKAWAIKLWGSSWS